MVVSILGQDRGVNSGTEGTTSGTDMDNDSAQWLEKGQGTTAQENTEDTQT